MTITSNHCVCLWMSVIAMAACNRYHNLHVHSIYQFSILQRVNNDVYDSLTLLLCADHMPPRLWVTSPTPLLGENYEATCTLAVESEEDLTVEAMQWLQLTGKCQVLKMQYLMCAILHTTGEPVDTTGNVLDGQLTFSSTTANRSLSILGLTTSHAGQYLCRASLAGQVPLEDTLSITFMCKHNLWL